MRDLSQIGKDWTLSFAFNPSSSFRFGFDLDVQSSGSIVSFDSVNVVAVGEFYATQKYAFRVTYGFSLIPNLALSMPGLGAGFIIWFSKKASVYLLYQDYVSNSEYSFGMKFLL